LTCDFWAENAENKYRRLRDGWGTRLLWLSGGEQEQLQIPSGDENRKDKNKAKAMGTATTAKLSWHL
jgi:hypothetical protein